MPYSQAFTFLIQGPDEDVIQSSPISTGRAAPFPKAVTDKKSEQKGIFLYIAVNNYVDCIWILFSICKVVPPNKTETCKGTIMHIYLQILYMEEQCITYATRFACLAATKTKNAHATTLKVSVYVCGYERVNIRWTLHLQHFCLSLQ